jgi:hypothetical protein
MFDDGGPRMFGVFGFLGILNRLFCRRAIDIDAYPERIIDTGEPHRLIHHRVSWRPIPLRTCFGQSLVKCIELYSACANGALFPRELYSLARNDIADSLVLGEQGSPKRALRVPPYPPCRGRGAEHVKGKETRQGNKHVKATNTSRQQTRQGISALRVYLIRVDH